MLSLLAFTAVFGKVEDRIGAALIGDCVTMDELKGSWRDSCKDCKYEPTIYSTTCDLSCKCLNTNEDYQPTTLDIDRCAKYDYKIINGDGALMCDSPPPPHPPPTEPCGHYKYGQTLPGYCPENQRCDCYTTPGRHGGWHC